MNERDDCGKPADAPSKTICPNCKEVSETPVFCDKCGHKLGVVFLGNEHIIELRNIFHGDWLKTLEVYNKAVDGLTTNVLHSPNLKQEYMQSANGCFDYLVRSAGDALTQEHNAYIQEKKNVFLTIKFETLFNLLTELDELSAIIGNMMIGVAKGYLELKAPLPLTKIFLDVWDNAYYQVFQERDKLWEVFCDMLKEITENTGIQFEIDVEALKKQIAPEENPIKTILVNHLKTKDSGCYFYEDIPPKKKVAAINSYVKNLDKDEEIICLYGSTVFGGAKEGICFTTKGMYWKTREMDGGKFISYSDIKKCTIHNAVLCVNDMIVGVGIGYMFKNAIKHIIAYYEKNVDYSYIVDKVVCNETKKIKYFW